MQAISTLLADLFRLHHRELVRFAAKLVGDYDGGEEVIQDTYLSIAGRSSHAKAINHPKSYLFMAARHAAFDFTTRQRSDHIDRIGYGHLLETASLSDPSAAMEARQELVQLAVALNTLPTACRQAFLMNKLEGQSHRDIARKLGISVSMVEKHIMRALKLVRDVRQKR